jgi:phosphoserine phosphatase RsbU/P
VNPAGELMRRELEVRRDRIAALLPRVEAPAASRGAGVAAELAGLLLRVDAALERLEAGAYGICQACLGEIGPDRLLADPLATFCLECLSPEQRRSLERDLETASRVQAALLPRRHLLYPGWEAAFIYEPAGTVSGDYCDVVTPAGEGGPLFVLFGDVSGKGVAASLLQSNLRALFHALVAPELGLAELLGRVNRLFCDATTPNAYATLLAARLDPDGGVEIANGGHPAPLLAHGGRVAPVEVTGLPLGLFCDARFATRRLRLGRGETLLFYTDGWTEAAEGRGEEYGRERAAAAFARTADRPVDDLLAACRADMESFVSGAARGDDLSLMAVRRAA